MVALVNPSVNSKNTLFFINNFIIPPKIYSNNTIRSIKTIVLTDRILRSQDIREQSPVLLLYSIFTVYSTLTPEPDCVGGDLLPEHLVVLYKKQGRLKVQKQVLDLNAGKQVDIVQRLVPDIEVGALTQADRQ